MGLCVHMADNILNLFIYLFIYLFIFFHYFSEKIRLGISCEFVCLADNSHEISSLVFSEKIYTNQNVNCCSCDLFELRFYSPVNPMGSCRAWSLLLGRLSPLDG